MKRILFLCLLPLSLSAQVSFTGYENNTTPDWDQLQQFWKKIVAADSRFHWFEHGMTDAGFPLPVVVYHPTQTMDSLAELLSDTMVTVMVMNGIHPGEPDGINASLEWAWKVKEGKIDPGNVVWVILPVYNLDGMLNRGCCSRANQEGPEEYGFRGNARNLDLNRDFMKQDSRNAQTFADLVRLADPDVFVDNHVSNGADYQYTLTMIPTYTGKLMGPAGNYLAGTMYPWLEKDLEKRKMPMAPYVHTFKEIPDSGLVAFLETPRYSTGYTALLHSIGFITETHMLKPFPQRVEATLAFLESLTDFVSKHTKPIRQQRILSKSFTIKKNFFPLSWELDSAAYKEISFMGYKATYDQSEVTGVSRLKYDRESPFTKNMRYYDQYIVTDSVQKPSAYLVPFAYEEVIAMLIRAGVKVEPYTFTDSLNVEAYYIRDYRTVKNAYEGHYLHYGVKTETVTMKIKPLVKYYKVPVGTAWDYFIVSALEPRAVDSWFAWNYFDGILQQKEWFSDYVWEDKAAEILANDPDLQQKLMENRSGDANISDPFQQLYFVFKNSPYYEKTHLLYPVFRVME